MLTLSAVALIAALASCVAAVYCHRKMLQHITSYDSYRSVSFFGSLSGDDHFDEIGLRYRKLTNCARIATIVFAMIWLSIKVIPGR